MDLLDVIMAVEGDPTDYTQEELLKGISEHKETLRGLQGFWGRLISDLEERELI